MVPVLPFAVLWMLLHLVLVLVVGSLRGDYQLLDVLLWPWLLGGVALLPLVARCEACTRCGTLRTGPFGWNIEAFDQTGLQYCLDHADDPDTST